MPLATEGNYTKPPLGELISGKEQPLVNEQYTVNEETPKREIPEELLAALETTVVKLFWTKFFQQRSQRLELS